MSVPVQVTLLGQTFSVRSDAPAEEIQRVAAYVNEKLAEVAGARRSVDSLSVALLTLLNVAGAHLRQGGGDAGPPPADPELEGRLRRLTERIAQARLDQPD